MSYVLSLALHDLAHDPLRTVFSTLGIAAVVMGTLLLTSLASGLSNILEAAPVSSNLLIIDTSFIDPSDSTLPPDLASSLKDWMPNPVRQVSASFYRQLRIEGRIIQLRASLPADWPQVYHMSLVEGRWPAAIHEVVVGEGSATANDWPVGHALVIFGEPYTVSGIYRSPGIGFSAIWMSMDAALALFGAERSVQSLVLVLTPGTDPTAVRAELQNLPGISGKYSVILEDSYTRRNGQIISDMFGLITLISLLAMLAVPMSTYSLTLLSLAERARAMGILRAVGFTHRAVRWFLLLRALVLAAGAFLLGLGSALVYIAMRHAAGPLFVLGFPFEFRLTTGQVILFLGITLIFALAGAWFSSYRQLNVPVNELLKD